jgi:hypothetical protein
MDRDLGSGAFLPPGSGIRIQDELFRISNKTPFFGEIFLHSESLLCYLYETEIRYLLKLTVILKP